MSQCGFGKPGDIYGKSLCIRGIPTIDSKRNVRFKKGDFSNLNVRGDVKINGNLLLSGQQSFGNLTIGDTLTSNNISVLNNLTSNKLYVTGEADFNDKLTANNLCVLGDTSFFGNVFIPTGNAQAGVCSLSGGITGLTPSIPTMGHVVLGGVLNETSGGTGLSTLGGTHQILGVNASGTSFEYKSDLNLTSGTFSDSVTSSNIIASNKLTAAEVCITNDINIDGNIVANKSVINDTLMVTGDSTFGNTNIDNLSVDNINASGISQFNSNVNVNAKMTVDDLCVTNNVDLSSLDSIDTNDLNVHGNLQVSGLTSLSGTISNTLTVSGESTFTGNVVMGNVEMLGKTTLSDVCMNGNLSGNNNIVLGVEDLISVCEVVEDWVQRGQDIDGEATFDFSGHSVSLSSDGNTVAIGARGNDGNGSYSGHTRVFDYVGSAWIQRGQDIDAEAAGDQSGYSVSLSSDGNTVAIGARGNDPSGHTRVFDWIGTSWIQRGQDIDGEATFDGSGFSVSLSSDGNTVAIGANGNDGSSPGDPNNNSGHTRVFDWNGGTMMWEQRGQDIDGEVAGDQSGHSVSLSSDGNTVAIGAIRNDANGTNSGQTRVFDWIGTLWVQRGQDIDGLAGDQSGHSVSLSSDGNTVAIGAPYNDGNGSSSGQTRVFDWIGTLWVQRGQDIDGEAAGDTSGWSVSLSSDGNAVAIGARTNDGNGNGSGHTRVFDWIGTLWVKRGSDIDGEAAGDLSGSSVSLSSDGNTVAIGATQNDGNGSYSGQTRVFGFDTCPVDGVDLLCFNISNVNAIYVDTLYSKNGVSTVTVDGALSVSNGLSVSGTITGVNGTISNTLTVGGESTLTGNVEMIGNVIISGTLFTSNIAGNSPVTINDDLIIQGDLNTNDIIANSINVASLLADSITSQSSNLVVSGNLVVQDTLYAGTIAGNSPVTFIDPIIAENIKSAEVYNITEHSVVSIFAGDSTGSFFNCSGFFISQDGWVATGAHCVLEDNISTKFDEANIYVTVTNVNGNSYADVISPTAGTLFVDGAGDIAIMKLPGITNQEFLEWGDSANIAKGSECYVIGNPIGADHQSISKGVVRDNAWIDVDGYQPVESVMTDCDIYGGNSGGSIVDSDGKIIGILNFGYGEPSVLNGGISQRLAQPTIQRMLTNQIDFNDATLGKGWLGITSWAAVDASVLAFNGLSGVIPPVGILILAVEPSGPVDSASGIGAGSIILEIDGIAMGFLPGYTAPSSITWTKTPGDVINVKVWTGVGGYPPPAGSNIAITLAGFPAAYDEPLNGGVSGNSDIHIIKPVTVNAGNKIIQMN
jgi:Trypsin-like peptidase domain/FG-GAP repeat